ncbi:hypothetical protein [Lacticaseibacillus nasuensis]|uniref:hypothetical protein n=1 Tax=Lacticaseibacillus nasuensis TaxID=944671 RepID=UPI0015856BA9|nr:hypothetical protein [Lacticaseibacillus nasuensis]
MTKLLKRKKLSDSKSYLEKEIAGTTDPALKEQFQKQLADATAALDKLTDTGTPANAFNDTNTPNKSTQASDQAKADADAAAAAEKAKADDAAALKAKEALVQTQAGYKLGLKGFKPSESSMQDPAFAAGYKQGAAERAAAQKSVVDATSKQEDAAKTAAENALKAKDALVEIQAGYKVGAQGLTPTDIAMKDPAFTAGYKQGVADKAARDAAAQKTVAENALKAKDALVEIQAGYKVGVQGFTPTKIAMQDPAFVAGYKQGVADKVAREAADGTAAENALKAKDALVEIQAGYKVGVQGFTPTALAMKDPAFVAGYNQGKADKVLAMLPLRPLQTTPLRPRMLWSTLRLATTSAKRATSQLNWP